ncbi:unnamed protein product [Arctogadus glacialis]
MTSSRTLPAWPSTVRSSSPGVDEELLEAQEPREGPAGNRGGAHVVDPRCRTPRFMERLRNRIVISSTMIKNESE